MKLNVLRIKDKLWAHYQGRTYCLPVSLSKGRSTEESAQDLVAPFTCKVLKVFVKPGQTVKKNETVVTVEAMKMEYAYTSPRDGVISRVLVEAGKIVQEGTPFVEWKS